MNKRSKTLVAVAELKANLSKYLKLVKSGEEIVITDHRTPVAKIESIDTSGFEVLESKRHPSLIKKLAASPALEKTDSLSILLEDRGRR